MDCFHPRSPSSLSSGAFEGLEGQPNSIVLTPGVPTEQVALEVQGQGSAAVVVDCMLCLKRVTI